MFENVRQRSAALAEPKPTPREVAEKLMVGIVLHDNRNTLAEGWAFLPGRAPFRVRGLYDLPNDAMWVSSGDFQDFRKLGQAQMHHVRRTGYLGLKLSEIAIDFGIRIDGHHALKGGQALAVYVQHAVRMAVEVYGLDDPMRNLQDDTLVATISKVLPPAPPSKDMLLQKLTAAYQSWSSRYTPFMDNSVRVRLRFNRMQYAEWLLSNPVPDAGWSHALSDLGFDHDAVMAGTFPPTLVQAVVEFDGVPAELAALIAYGIGATRQRAKRTWMTDVEYRWMSKYARVHVKSYLVSAACLPLPTGCQLPPMLAQDRLVKALPASGLVSYMHCQALMSAKYSRVTNSNEYDVHGTWLRAHDRAICFEGAQRLQDAGFQVSGYGNGSVIVNVDREKLVALEQAAVAMDFTMPRWNALLQEFGYVSPDHSH
ncbi:hypothetical protein JAB5_58020 [Janthinobacterium sp. HH103]|nr:hypothetical protein JAB2_50940 [Janthinobacterium sp. HH100]OEZ66376.1 hypothetical protein JAB5_58020 [Janthinobacterium sp. HH103]QOU76165.1 hypothetical protein JAB4_056650 [Janthinobacterium sp. HH102]